MPPSVLNFVSDPEAGGVFVVHDLDDEATFMVAYDDQKESLEDYDDARCAPDLVRGALEDPDLDFRVETISTWAMTAQVAERYRAGPHLSGGRRRASLPAYLVGSASTAACRTRTIWPGRSPSC